MAKRTLFACEAPWSKDDGTLVEWSMREALSGLCQRLGVRFLYRTFTSGDELEHLLASQVPTSESPSTVVYVSSHGNGGRFDPGFAETCTNLSRVAQAARRGIDGVWVSACEVANSESMRDFLTGGGAAWAGGFTCAVDFDAAMLIDLAILQAVLPEPSPQTRANTLATFTEAFQAFSPTWMIGDDSNDVRVSLSDGVRLLARDRVKGARVEDATAALKDKLRWA